MEDPLPGQSPFAVSGGMDLPRTRQFLSGIVDMTAGMKGKLPLLTDIAALCAGTPGAAALRGPVRGRLNRRYLRIRFVQSELERLDFKKAAPGVRFDDFVFEQIDFSTYKKISEEEYSLYSPEGLEDFEDSFFTRNFRVSREKIRGLINGSYTRIGGFYFIKQEKMLSNPLLMSVLRTLQTSLEFAPLLTKEAIRDECRIWEAESGAFFPPEDGNRFFACLLRALHGASVVHSDGMKTELSTVQEANTLVLRGAFHPQGKTYTVTLARSGQFAPGP
jgi:hypothetical protein